MKRTDAKKIPVNRILALTVIGFLLGLIIFFLIVAFPVFFTRLPVTALLNLAPSLLKGGSPIGFKLAYMGVVMLVVAQTYSLRIRAISTRRLRAGPVSEWLNMHCYLTVAGASLILIHSGFPFAFTFANPFNYIYLGWGIIGLVGVQGLAAWLTLLLLFSGIFGKYLYGQLGAGVRKLFRRWLTFHVTITGALYTTGVIHLIITVWLKHTSAV